MKNSDKDQVVAYIGLGSNLENPAEQINSAHAAIAGLNDVEELAFSSLYHSPPMGPQDQPVTVEPKWTLSLDKREGTMILHFWI
jgi:2-amino-4-hydroxy-6-hydroxymethyldihydropteridine diphosphokinase